MDDHRTVSVSRVYVPNEYTVYLSPHDRTQFQAYEDSLKLELQEYLAEHARREHGLPAETRRGAARRRPRRSRAAHTRDRQPGRRRQAPSARQAGDPDRP